MQSRIYGTAQVQFSIETTEEDSHAAIQDIVDKIADGTGIIGFDLKLAHVSSEVIELEVDDWNVETLEYFDEDGM